MDGFIEMIPMSTEEEVARRLAGMSIPKKWNLKRMKTRELMHWLAKTRKFNGYYDPTEDDGPGVTAGELKEELAKREHIFNKPEQKRLRKLMNKKRLTREEVLSVKKFRKHIFEGAPVV